MKKVAVGTVFLLLLDRISKWYLLSHPNLYLGNFVRLKLFYNKGFYFFSSGNYINPIILLAGGIVLFFLILFLIKNRQNSLLSFSILLMILGGVSNLFDRIYYGFVIDFIWLKFLPISIFNLADVLIFLGIICLLFNLKKFK